MGRQRHRAVKTRQPKELQLALGVSLIWLALGVFFWMSGGFGGKSSPTVFLVSTALTPMVWWWAIHTIRRRNAAGKTIEQLQALSPDAFEEWVGARFRDLGYSVKIAGMQGDHGVDLVAEKQGEIAVIQCKKYKTSSVGEPVLRDLYGAMHDFSASRAYLVTTGSLTRPATDWVAGKPIEVWDGEYLARLAVGINTHHNTRSDLKPEPSGSDKSAVTTVSTIEPIATPDRTESVCPKCGSLLVTRRNRKTDELFLACPKYPGCRHTEPLPA